jgi:hypothetical protein
MPPVETAARRYPRYEHADSLALPTSDDLVVPVYTAGTTRKRIDMQDKVEAYQYLIREIMPFFSNAEFRVYSQIVDRCIGWGKPYCFTSIRKIARGDDTWKGCGLSEPVVKRAIKSLIAEGVITTEGTPRGTRFRVLMREDQEGQTAE